MLKFFRKSPERKKNVFFFCIYYYIRVLAKCSSALGKGDAEDDSPTVPLDRAFEESYRAAYEELAGRGERVLACATLALDGSKYPADFEFDEENYPQEGGYRCKGVHGFP